MIRFFTIANLTVFLFCVPAFAQVPDSSGKQGEILGKPICSYLTNRSDQTIIGTIATAAQTVASGDVVKHRQNFKLSSGERRQFCAAGPFYEGRRLELTLRTIIPLFSCKTKIEREIFLDAQPDDNGIKKLSATCH